MTKPIVAIVGRPNVGKSTLVNRIAQTSDAIVHETRGVTRDRSYHEADWNGKHFILIDTGGIEMDNEDIFQESIRDQAFLATEEADVVVFITEAQTGVTTDDQEVSRILQHSQKPIVLAVNKLDNPDDESALWEFYSLGLGDPLPISAIHGHGTGDLLDHVVKLLPNIEDDLHDEDDDAINVAIIGRPNAGKSSLTNKLTGLDRSIVSDHAGTTRDALDTLVEHEGQLFRIVDTAGLRRKSQINDDLEYYGFVRAMRAIDRADVALLVVDSIIGITDQDQRVAGLAQERGCALIILLNKWDLLDTEEKREAILSRIEEQFGFVMYAPVIRISALTGRSIHRIWDAIRVVDENHSQKIATSKLNNLLGELREFGHTVTKGNRQLKLR
ncbi:MAG: ribosome biogenesis GTPase Der, partial [Coriobacteriia bacterium]|nr:ribosome biogenesis GTPase Der [Coriobacteriia bacterium]